MTQQSILAGAAVTWGAEVAKINSNYTELYGRMVADATVWPCYNGQAGCGTYMRLRAGSYYNELKGGTVAANRSWILPVGAPPSAGTTRLLNVNENGQMGQIDPATFEPARTAASQAEAEAGTEAALRSFSPLRIKQAIVALGGSGGGSYDAVDINIVDVGTYFAGGNVEAALQELGAVFDALTPSSAAYTPTWTASTTNPAIGNGSLVGEFSRFGDVVVTSIELTIGSTTTLGSGLWRFALPLTPTSSAVQAFPAELYSATMMLSGMAHVANGVAYCDIAIPGGLSYVDATHPWAWVATNKIRLSFTYLL